MINNDYNFSLKLYLKFVSIDNLLLYTSVRGKVANHYTNFLKPHISKLTFLQFPTKNRSVTPEELTQISIELQTMINLIVSSIQKETKRNLLTALGVLKDECESLQKLL